MLVLPLLALLCERHEEGHAKALLLAGEPAGGGVLPADGGIIPAVNMPKAPLRGQKRPPCASDEQEHVGACWMQVKRKPPCNEYYRLGEACYLPVAEPRKGQPITGEP